MYLVQKQIETLQDSFEIQLLDWKPRQPMEAKKDTQNISSTLYFYCRTCTATFLPSNCVSCGSADTSQNKWLTWLVVNHHDVQRGSQKWEKSEVEQELGDPVLLFPLKLRQPLPSSVAFCFHPSLPSIMHFWSNFSTPVLAQSVKAHISATFWREKYTRKLILSHPVDMGCQLVF